MLERRATKNIAYKQINLGTAVTICPTEEFTAMEPTFHTTQKNNPNPQKPMSEWKFLSSVIWYALEI